MYDLAQTRVIMSDLHQNVYYLRTDAMCQNLRPV